MAEIINFSPAHNTIDVAALRSNTRQLRADLIAPVQTEEASTALVEHDAEPIKNYEDIACISDYLIGKGRYRDNMLFIVGINFGLRASDLLQLRFMDVINSNLTFKDRFPVFEIKTRSTRKRKKNRYITVNDAAIEAITMYLENTPGVSLSDYMFQSMAHNRSEANKPISVRSLNRLLENIGNECGLNIRFSTHSLRKTFCYWMMMYGHNDPRRLLLLQKMLGHATPAQTLDYIGITCEEIDDAYRKLNLGSISKRYISEVKVVEFDAAESIG